VLVVPVSALGAWAALAAVPDPTQAGAQVAPVVAPVTAAERRASGVVTVEVREAAGVAALSATSGTVTATVPLGTVLADGDEAARIDDRPVRAMVAAAPLWRTLARGDEGDDVRRLQQHLVATGHLAVTPDGVFGASTATAVAAYARELGMPRGTTTFDPAWVVWVGPEPLEVQAVSAPVGTRVDPGTALLTGPGTAQAVAVTEPQGGLGGSFGSQAELVVGQARVPYQVGSGVVTAAADVVVLVGALAPGTSGAGRVEAVDAAQVLSVPASSVVAGTGGAVCVYPDADATPVVVVTVGGGASTVQIDPASVPDGLTSVLVNPGALDGLAPCG
jgi:peptidoglycan hydrolase-like protein with peptidoglycan-binding domain